LKTLWIKRKKVEAQPDEQSEKALMNSARNPENYRIFPANPKTDGMEAQPYSD
jgi:hypothetical protein